MNEKNKNSQTWLFMGPELGEKQSAIDQLRKKLACGEETVFYAGETQVPSMVSAMQNGSLFADTRLFFIKSAEGIKKKEDIDLLSQYIVNPPADTYLILVSDETNVPKGLENSISPANKKIFWELSDSRKYEWVQNFFRKEELSINHEGIETVLEMVENNTAALKQECSRLIVFLEGEANSDAGGGAERRREINAEQIEKWLSHTREESAFTLFSRIAAGDFSRSLESSRILLDAARASQNRPVAIFAGLASCFRKLINYLELKNAGVSDDMEYRKIGVSAPGAKRDYSSAARRYNSEAAESCLALTAEYDLLLRSGSSFSEQILMDQYLYKIHSLSSGGIRA